MGPQTVYLNAIPVFPNFSCTSAVCSPAFARASPSAPWLSVRSASPAGSTNPLRAASPPAATRSVTVRWRERYAGAVDAARQLVRAHGVRALFRGVGLNCAQAGPGGIASMLVFEAAMEALGHEDAGDD